MRTIVRVAIASQPPAPLLQSFVLLAIPIVVTVLLLVGRRPKIILRARPGRWIETNERISGWVVSGIIEPYNKSGRSNTIVRYELLAQCDGQWISTDCEEYIESTSDDFERRHWPTPEGPGPTTATPMKLGPYSDACVRITAVTTKRPTALRITVTDSFGKKYSIEVPADSQSERR